MPHRRHQVLPAVVHGEHRRPGPGEQGKLVSEQRGPAAPIAADGGGARAEGWARYVQELAVELGRLGRPAVGLAGTISSDLPAGEKALKKKVREIIALESQQVTV